MKHIIFIKELNSEEKAQKIQDALEGTRVEFKISLADQAVIVEGNNDIIHLAKTMIREAGFNIE